MNSSLKITQKIRPYPLPVGERINPALLCINQRIRDAAPTLQYRDKDYGIPKRETRQVRGKIYTVSTLTPTLFPKGPGPYGPPTGEGVERIFPAIGGIRE